MINQEKKYIIPKNAKLIFKGTIFEVWQWEQEMYDGSTAIFERLRRPDTVQVIATTKDKNILLLEQEQPGRPGPFPSLPGGRVDPGEKPEDAVKRELLEEAGYVGSDWELLGQIQPHNKIAWTIYTYLARACAKIQDPTPDAGEKITSKLITFEEFLQLSNHPFFYERELSALLLRARYDNSEKDKLYQKLFG